MTEDAMTPTIVVGIDGSAHSIQALLWAARDAQMRNAALELVHVLPQYEHDVPFFPPGRWEEARDRGQDLLAETTAILEDAYPGITWTSDMPSGTPAKVFVEKSKQAQLMVLGAKGTDLGNLLMGSTTTQVIGHAECPVVVVGHPAGGHGRVLVGNDGSLNAEDALVYGFEEASRRGAALHVVRAWKIPLPSDRDAIAQELKIESTRRERELARDLEPLRSKYPDVEVIADAPCGDPVHVLARASHRADLLVVGSRGLGGFHGLTVGSASHKLLRLAACPVAVVRPAHTTQH